MFVDVEWDASAVGDEGVEALVEAPEPLPVLLGAAGGGLPAVVEEGTCPGERGGSALVGAVDRAGAGDLVVEAGDGVQAGEAVPGGVEGEEEVPVLAVVQHLVEADRAALPGCG